jgi:hypothetical protein
MLSWTFLLRPFQDDHAHKALSHVSQPGSSFCSRRRGGLYQAATCTVSAIVCLEGFYERFEFDDFDQGIAKAIGYV